jgi:hypothetical protein
VKEKEQMGEEKEWAQQKGRLGEEMSKKGMGRKLRGNELAKICYWDNWEV